ncbi:MAG: YbjN domain-containing protein [Alphaproteobacteria bacterium]|nr:YbjN domain-containing protein [Alphaproteobacteria bacterium]
MRVAINRTAINTINPLDLVEEIVSDNDWSFDRRSQEEMLVEVPGHWATYSLFFAWSHELRAMHFSVTLDIRVPEHRRTAVCELLTAVNERMWLGHFILWDEDSMPMFRYSVLGRDDHAMSQDHLETLVDIAVRECERFFPAFQFVIWGGKSAEEAVSAAMLDTVGEC